MNMAAVTSEAAEIISSVLASGPTPERAPTSTKNEQRILVESGLANACSCEMAEPTATVTSEYTLPPVVRRCRELCSTLTFDIVHHRRLSNPLLDRGD
jgi:hypothetical protein